MKIKESEINGIQMKVIRSLSGLDPFCGPKYINAITPWMVKTVLKCSGVEIIDDEKNTHDS